MRFIYRDGSRRPVFEIDDAPPPSHILDRLLRMTSEPVSEGTGLLMPSQGYGSSVSLLAGILLLLASPPGSTMVTRAVCLAEGLPDDALDERRGEET